jgi:hypothetical protein
MRVHTISLVCLILACSDTASTPGGASSGSSTNDAAAPADATTPPADAGLTDAKATPRDAEPQDAVSDMRVVPSYCSGQKLCDDFESYPAATLKNGGDLGAWRSVIEQGNGSAAIDNNKSFSGTRSLKIHINPGSAGGAQLRTKSSALFGSGSPKLYGKFRMFLENGAGTSNHWTMFGGSGVVPAGVPIAGNHVTYLFSAFNDNGSNRFGNVFYNDQTRQDCWHHSTQKVPTGRWACVGFSVDGPKIEYRAQLDGQPVPSLSVDQKGDGCLNAAPDAPWYGPNFDEFYVGALSFHPMSAGLDLWIDDVVLDTKPVACE